MNKNIRKYSGLSMIVGATLVLSGCDTVSTSSYHASKYNHVYLSSRPESDNSTKSVVITKSLVKSDSGVSTTSEEPYAYAGYGYKKYEESLNEEPYAYAGYGYKKFEESENEEPYAYAGYGYKKFEESKNEEPYAYAGYGYKKFEESKNEEPYAYAGYGYKKFEESKNEEPYAYAGYGYKKFEESQQGDVTNNDLELSGYSDILYSTETISMDGKYVYLRNDEFYKVTSADSVDDLCKKFNISVDELCAHNPNVVDYGEGVVIAYPVMSELYVGKKGDDINSIAIETGVDVDYIIDNNKLDLSDGILNNDAHIFLHKFIGNENSYKTNKGIVNIINNNRIFGNKVIQASGFSGASRYVMAMNESVYSYGVNDVTCYAFDGDSYSSNVVCLNAKDIINVDGMPVALLRNDDDIASLALSAGVDVDDMAYMQWGSTVSDGYSINTSGNSSYVILTGVKMDNLDLEKSESRIK